MNAKRHRSPASSKFLATSLSIALLYLELLIPLLPSILFVSRPRWEALAERNRSRGSGKTSTQVAFEFIDASRFYLYVDLIYICALALSFVIYLLAPIHNTASILNSIRGDFSHHHTIKGVFAVTAGAIVIVASGLRVTFYLVSIIDTAVNGRLRLWRFTNLPPKNQNKVTIDALDQERSPLHLNKSSRYTWFTLTALSILLAATLLSLVEFYIQGGSLRGTPIGQDQATINFNLLMLWWWPHQLFSLHNPFAATFVATHGVNLSLSPSSELLSILAAPITIALGPNVSLTIIQIVLPAIAGIGTYRFARVLGATRMGALGAGLLFEVAAIVPSSFSGHLDVAMVCLFPVVAGELLAYVQGRLSRRRTILGVALFFIATYLTSIGIGVLATLIVAAVSSTATLAYGRDAAKRLRKIAPGLIFSLTLAVVVALPNLYFAIFDHRNLTVVNHFDLQSALTSRGGHLLAIASANSSSHYLFLDPLLIIASILLICVNLLNRRSRAGVIVATLAAASLALVVGPSFTFGTATWPGTLLLGHSIAPLPMTIPNSLPGLNLITQEMLVDTFVLFASILVGLFASHTLASSRSEHFAVNEGLNYATILATALGVISAIPFTSIGESVALSTTSVTSIGKPAALFRCLQGTTSLLELPPDGSALSIAATVKTGHILPTVGASIGYDVTYPPSLLESILAFSGHSKVAYIQTFEHEIDASTINTVVALSISSTPWNSYISAIGSKYHVVCSSNQVSISRR